MLVEKFGLNVQNDDPNYKLLIDKLKGNPLAIRVILMQLKKRSTQELLQELETGFHKTKEDESSQRLQNVIRIFDESLDEKFVPVLRQLGLHENLAIPAIIESMLDETVNNTTILLKDCFHALSNAGLCHSSDGDVYKLHPALQRSLSKLYPASDDDKIVFVEAMCEIISAYTPLELHAQYSIFTMYGANFRHALRFASELDMNENELVLIQGLAIFTENTRNYAEAIELYNDQAKCGNAYGYELAEAGAYHQLGSIACKQKNYDSSEAWYNKSLPIFNANSDERGIAQTYHQLGVVAYFRGNLDGADTWLKQSLAIDSKRNNEESMAKTYRQLGAVAYERRDYDAAEDWYKQSVSILLRHGDLYRLAIAYAQLGSLSVVQKDYVTAENWYKYASEIYKTIDDPVNEEIVNDNLAKLHELLSEMAQTTSRVEKVIPNEVKELSYKVFVWRSAAIHQLERAMRQPQSGILIHGMAGEGKTTLIKGFLQWLEDTGGLKASALWFSFDGIHSAAYVIDTLTEKLIGIQAMLLPLEQKLHDIIKNLRTTPIIIVWDNFESVSGYEGMKGLLSDSDRNILKNLLRALHNGATKVLITSRSQEGWLDTQECFRLRLDGLQGEELWQYCNAVGRELGLTSALDNPAYKSLIDKMQGNPLAIRVTLMQLEKRSEKELLDEFRRGELSPLLQALDMFDNGMDKSLAPVLRMVGLHEQFADADYISQMLDGTEEISYSVKTCFAILEKTGLCHEVALEQGYRLHPVLRATLSVRHPANETERKAFVDLMAALCNSYEGKQLHEQYPVFELFGMNFRNALELAWKMDMQDCVCSLLTGLGMYTYNSHHLSESETLYEQCADAGKRFDRPRTAAVCYHQLGMIAEERRDFDTAEKRYKQSLAIKLKQGNDSDAARSYGALGNIACELRDFDAADDWYKKSLEIALRLGDDDCASVNYHHLGLVTEELRDYKSSIMWYNQSLEITQRLGNKQYMAYTYNQLGNIMFELNDYDAAETWYKQALSTWLRLGDDHGAIITYPQLGEITRKRQEYGMAEKWYEQALELTIHVGDKYSQSIILHYLGINAHAQQNYDDAEEWYQQSLKLKIEQGYEHGAAITYGALRL